MLKDKRAAFLRQQERVQARNVVDHAASTRQKPPAPAAAAAAATSAAAEGASGEGVLGLGSGVAVGFQGFQTDNWLADTDKYAAVLAIRKLPIGQKMKKVIELLFRERTGLTAVQVEQVTSVDLTTSRELQEALKSNPKVAFDGGKYMYKAKHDLTGRDDLLRLIREHKDGLPLSDVKDSYTAVMAHVQELRSVGQIWVLFNSDNQEEVVFPNDPRIHVTVDADIRQLVRSVDIPRDLVDLEKELQRCGQKPALPEVRRLQALDGALLSQLQKPKQKRKRVSSRTKYTNNHLPELFTGGPF